MNNISLENAGLGATWRKLWVKDSKDLAQLTFNITDSAFQIEAECFVPPAQEGSDAITIFATLDCAEELNTQITDMLERCKGDIDKHVDTLTYKPNPKILSALKRDAAVEGLHVHEFEGELQVKSTNLTGARDGKNKNGRKQKPLQVRGVDGELLSEDDFEFPTGEPFKAFLSFNATAVLRVKGVEGKGRRSPGRAP